MNTKEIWAAYVPDATPGELMCRFELRNPARCVDRYLEQLGNFYGVVRHGTWRSTFSDVRQMNCETVRSALTAHLEETRPEWDEAVDKYMREMETMRRKESEARAVEAAVQAEVAPSPEEEVAHVEALPVVAEDVLPEVSEQE